MDLVHRQANGLSALPVWLFSSGPLGEEIKDGMDQIRQLPELRETLDPRDHRIFFGSRGPSADPRPPVRGRSDARREGATGIVDRAGRSQPWSIRISAGSG